jgi:hypothetical protein
MQDKAQEICGQLDTLARELDSLAWADARAQDAAADVRALRVRLGDAIVWEPSDEDRGAIALASSEPGQWSPRDRETLAGCADWLSACLQTAREDWEQGA